MHHDTPAIPSPSTLSTPGSRDAFAAGTTGAASLSQTPIMDDAVVRQDGDDAVPQPFMTDPAHPLLGDDHPSATPAMPVARYAITE